MLKKLEDFQADRLKSFQVRLAGVKVIFQPRQIIIGLLRETIQIHSNPASSLQFLQVF